MSLRDYDEMEGAAANARPAQPAQAWEYLRVTYVGLDTVQHRTSITQLQQLKMQPGEAATTYWQRATALRCQLATAGGNIEDWFFIKCVPDGLPLPKYSFFVQNRAMDQGVLNVQQYMTLLCQYGSQ